MRAPISLVLALLTAGCSFSNDLEVALPQGARFVLENVSLDLPAWELASKADVARAEREETEWLGQIAAGFLHRADELRLRDGGPQLVRVRIVVADFDSGTAGHKYRTLLMTGVGVLRARVVVPGHGELRFERVLKDEFEIRDLQALGAEIADALATLR